MSLRQPFGRHSQNKPVTPTALREAHPKLRLKLQSLYRVAHIRCHLSSRASPPRTNPCRRLDSLSALRNYFVGGREEMADDACLVWERTWRSKWVPSPPLYIGWEAMGKNPKCPPNCIIDCIIMNSVSTILNSVSTIHEIFSSTMKLPKYPWIFSWHYSSDIFPRPFYPKNFPKVQNISGPPLK